MTRRFLVLLALVLAVPVVSPAQQVAPAPAARRALTHADYDTWRSISQPRLSRDGKFLAYLLVPQDADGEFVLRNLTTGKETRFGIGTRPQPSGVDEETGNPIPVTDVAPVFTADGKFVLFQVRPAKADMEKARKEKKRADDMPKNATGIMTVATGTVARVERTKSFQLAEDAPGFAAILMEARQDSAAPARTGRGRVDYGTDLVLRNLTDNTERTFPDALEYSFARDGKSLVFAVSSRNEGTNGVFAVTPGTDTPAIALLRGKGRYRRITWDDRQSALAFLADQGDSANTLTSHRLYRWDRQAPVADELVSPLLTAGFPRGMVVSERGTIDFSRDGGSVFFGVAPPADPPADSNANGEEKALVDLWNWRDEFIQPMQKVRANQERNRSYRAVYHEANKSFAQLADTALPTISIADNGSWGVGQDDRPYRRLVGVEGSNISDLYAVNTASGQRTLMLTRHSGNVTVSPSGKTALYFKENDWYLASIAEGRAINLTKAIKVPFYQEDFDSPQEAPSWGNAGWTKDEKYVLLNDRFDVWLVATDGTGGTNLTDGIGRRDRIVFRYLRLDAPAPGEAPGIDGTKPIYLTAVGEWSREEGVYRDRIGGGPPERLLWANKTFGGMAKAKDADVVILTQQTFNEFPDIHVTTPEFKGLKKVTDANPQKSGLIWGNSELVRFRNTDGVQLSGILTKPENFDPSKKYPMMVYIYEKLSQNVNRFVNPSPGTSINASFYASNGYLVLQPDIVYTIGYPGASALKAVLPAIQAVVDKGYVNEEAIGIQGHSWGGYQIAYMTTRTNRFKAAAPGAVVVNMTSAYSGIRWESGLPRQFQYEHTQSRIGGTIWEEPLRFVENSPLFQLDRVQTPILTIHNDADGAVPWYQGIEYYLGLRRLGKEVYLFNYNGEPHGLRKRINQEDYTRRLQEYFDHFLKGAPEPDWMKQGVPFLERDKPRVTS